MEGRRKATLAVISAASALLLLDVTVVYVALPAIQEDIGASFEQLQWVVDAYALALATTLLTAGVLGDRIGRRRVFVAGVALFTASSLLCGLADDGTVLDLARAVQGVGGAAMFATSLALLAAEFQGRERATALGVWGAITGASLALGPLAGGALVDGPGWRWAFFVNLPLGIALIWLTLRFVAESRDPQPRGFDPGGLVAFSAACLLLVLGLLRDSEVLLVAAGAAAVVFAVVERRVRSPMLEPALFRIPAFTGTAVVAFAQSLALYPLLLFLALWFQDVLRLTPWQTGLRLLPLTVVVFLVAPLSGRLTARLPLRVPLVGGLLLIAASGLLMRGLEPGSEWTELLPGLLVGGLAVGTISPPLAAAMVGVLSVERSGLASGINNTFRQLGIAVGIALLGAIFEAEARGGGAAGFADGLNDVFLVAALVAMAGAAAAWPLLGGLRAAGAEPVRSPACRQR